MLIEIIKNYFGFVILSEAKDLSLIASRFFGRYAQNVTEIILRTAKADAKFRKFLTLVILADC
jgi:hypothetical protein